MKTSEWDKNEKIALDHIIKIDIKFDIWLDLKMDNITLRLN